MPIKKLILVRHGETAWSLTGQHTGLTDIPLTENGKKQALELKHLLAPLPLAHTFVSPLIRAKSTFDLLDLQVNSSLDDDLKEWNYGDYEGLTSNQIHETNPTWNLFSHGAPGGESLTDVINRAKRIIDKAMSVQGDVAFFSSGHILRTIATVWLKQDIALGRHLTLQPASLSILSFEHETPSILLWNRVAFLPH